NNAVGFSALAAHTTGIGNNAVGALALVSDIEGEANNAFGREALMNNTTGTDNIAIGDSALHLNATGTSNVAIGTVALASSKGNLNTAVGIGAGGAVTRAANVICLGANVGGANVNNTCFIGNIRGVTTINNNAIPVLIDTAGQ